jgi:type III secretion protein Y
MIDFVANEDVPDEVIDLIHCLGFIYLRHGQPYRAVVLLLVAAQAAQTRTDLLRTLAGALVAARMGDQAIDVLDRLALLEPALTTHPMMCLLRARALLLLGRVADARAAFAARR